MPRVLTCARCGCALLGEDYRGVPVAAMDRALAHHSSGGCINGGNSWCAAQLSFLLGPAGSPPPGGLEEAIWPHEETPLLFCVRQRVSSLALRVLEAGLGADYIDALGRDGSAALHLSCASDELCELSRALLRAGASAETRTQDDPGSSRVGGCTPLHAAASAGAAASAALLLEAQPSLALATDWEGALPASAAWLAGHAELAATLARAALDAGRAAAACGDAAAAGALEEATELLDGCRDEPREAEAVREAEASSQARCRWLSIRERHAEIQPRCSRDAAETSPRYSRSHDGAHSLSTPHRYLSTTFLIWQVQGAAADRFAPAASACAPAAAAVESGREPLAAFGSARRRTSAGTPSPASNL